MCSSITRGRVLNVELYAERFQKLIYPHRRQKLTLLHLFTGLFRKEFFLTHQNICKIITIDKVIYPHYFQPVS